MAAPSTENPYFKNYYKYALQQPNTSLPTSSSPGEQEPQQQQQQSSDVSASSRRLVPSLFRHNTPPTKFTFPKVSLFGRHSERTTPSTEVPPMRTGGRTKLMLSAIQGGVLKKWYNRKRAEPGGGGTEDVLDGRLDDEVRVWKQGKDFKSVTFDGSVSGFNSRLPSRAERVKRLLPSDYSFATTDSVFSGTSSAKDPWFKVHVLLELSDEARVATYNKRLHIQHSLVERLAVFLQTAISEEDREMQTIEFDTIKDAHLDRLLDEVVQGCKDGKIRTSKPLGYLADSLSKKWRVRFKAQYFMLDEIRMLEMTMKGRLKEVSFTAPMGPDGGEPFVWKALDTGHFSDATLDLDVGKWWLNLACAHRDGIVSSELERPTTEKYGTTVLPLLTGREELIDGDPNKTKYIREGRLADMYFSLLSGSKDPLRIIRGYRLRSEYAPEAGVRYDGLWKLVRHGYRRNPNSGRWRIDLYLERIPNQTSMDEMLKIPTPSQMDDWYLYKKLENSKMEQAMGKVGAFEWRLRNEKDKRERVEDARMREFRSSISATPMESPGWGRNSLSKPVDMLSRKTSIHLQLPPKAQAKVKNAERETTGKWVIIDESRNQKVEFEKLTPHVSLNASPAVSPGTREFWL